MDNLQVKPWHQYVWVWVLIFIPFTAVIFGIVMFVMADIHRDDLVVDDYYKDGMAINLQLSMDEKARSLDIHASLSFLSSKRLSLTVKNARDSAIRINFYHVADSQKDRAAVLVPEGDSIDSMTVYSVDDADIASLLQSSGIWFVEIAGVDDSWRLRKRIETPVSRLELEP